MKLTKNVKARLGLAARMAAVMTIGALGLARAPAAHADERATSPVAPTARGAGTWSFCGRNTTCRSR